MHLADSLFSSGIEMAQGFTLGRSDRLDTYLLKIFCVVLREERAFGEMRVWEDVLFLLP
jgi:hypothetical protein